ncbi:MAG: S8 family serine peptidase [Lachnospiraceae bacterium]|nr:S8 family serine peptidase [Lachnospiraceae bacterium]
MNKRFRKIKALSLLLVLILTVSQPLSVLGATADLDEIGNVGEGIVSDELIVDSETVDLNSAADEGVSEQEELPFGLTGMYEGFKVSAQDMHDKRDMAVHNVLDQLSSMEAGVDYVEDEVFFLADSKEYAEEVAKAYNAELDSYRYGVAVLKLDLSKISVIEAVEAGMDIKLNLPHVEPNYYGYIEPEITADPTAADMGIAAYSDVSERQSYSSLYGTYVHDPYLNPTSNRYEWYHDMINTYAAWGVTTGSSKVTVAVLDTGVSNHVEFGSRLTRAEVIPTAKDYSGHGTNVAGIIGAGFNSAGGAGIAPNVNLLSVPVFATTGCTWDDVIAGIRYVSGYDDYGNKIHERRADIINMSLGGPGYTTDFQQVIYEAREAGVTVVAAAGNEYTNTHHYPAAYDGVIAVAALYPNSEKTGFSNYGDFVDIAAPGWIIWSTHNGASSSSPITNVYADTGTHSEYCSMNGTSQATPIIAGACALYMSAVGHVSPSEMEAVLKKSTNKPLSAGMGAGVIDLAKMFEADRSAPDISCTLDKGVLPYGGSITISPSSPVTSSTGITGLGGKIVFSVNGKAPVVLNGEVVNGAVYSSPITADLLLSEYGISAGSKVSLMAATVSGMGVMSNIKSLVFTVGAKPEINPAKLKSIILSKSKKEMIASQTDYLYVSGITDINGNDLYVYDKNYVWTSSNPNVVSVNGTDMATVTLTAKGRGSAKIVCRATDGSKASAVCVVTVTQPVTSITVTGQNYISPGGKAVYKAVPYPATANNKAVEWTLVAGAPSGVDITQKGLVTVDSSVPTGSSFTVVANAKDGSYASGCCQVIVAERAQSVKVDFDDYLYKYIPSTAQVYNPKTGSLASARMYTLNTPFPSEALDESQFKLNGLIKTVSGSEYSGYNLAWTSSNPAVVSLSDDMGPSTTLKAHKAGKAVITCRTTDGTNRAASVVINVIVPASSIMTYSSKRQQVIADGCSVMTNATIGTLYGTPTIKNLNWDYQVISDWDSNDDPVYYASDTEYAKKHKLVTIKNGKVVLAKNFYNYFDGLKVTATTTDGTDLSSSYVYYGSYKPTYFVWENGKKAMNLNGNAGWYRYVDFYTDSSSIAWKTMTLTSSNPSVASVQMDQDDYGYWYLLIVYNKKGNAKITATLNDGSNMSIVLNVKVK